MKQNVEHENSMQNFTEIVAIEHKGKSNKCNLCDYASSNAGHLRTHLKMHSGENSNKCNQCDYASSYAHVLKDHLKKTLEKSPTNATSVVMHHLGQAI